MAAALVTVLSFGLFSFAEHLTACCEDEGEENPS
jgi:hypothetical protein